MVPSKPDLRNLAFKRRDGVEAEIRIRYAERLADTGLDLINRLSPCPKPIVALYSPIGSEPDINPLADALHKAGITLCLPVDWSTGTPLIYRLWSPGDRLASGPLGIGEPLEGAAEVDPDIVFTPMAAFERTGHRVGYGAGNVDRTLAALRARKSILVIGLAFAVQEVEAVPVEPHDEPLDVVITEAGLIHCRS